MHDRTEFTADADIAVTRVWYQAADDRIARPVRGVPAPINAAAFPGASRDGASAEALRAWFEARGDGDRQPLVTGRISYIQALYINRQQGIRPMAKDKDKKKNGARKKARKESQLAIRVEKGERDAFVALCERLDTSAAREIRRFMRDFVASHAPAEPAPEPVTPAPEPEAEAPKPRRKAPPKAATTDKQAEAPAGQTPG